MKIEIALINSYKSSKFRNDYKISAMKDQIDRLYIEMRNY